MKGSSQLASTLSHWKLVEFLYLHQACMLALNVDPSDNATGRGFTNHPQGYNAIYQAIEHEIISIFKRFTSSRKNQ